MTDKKMDKQTLIASAKPILFNTEMVRAILDGRKTVTRRVAKTINPNICCQREDKFNHEFIRDDFIEGYKYTGYICRKCGYGVSPPHSKYSVGSSYIRPPYEIGDILYVRETWGTYTPDPEKFYPRLYFKASNHAPNEIKWRPSIHMPKEVARIFLRVTDIRVERLQDITMSDMQAEGVIPQKVTGGHWKQWQCDYMKPMWDNSINPKMYSLYRWNANPWVWVIRFEKIEVN